MKHFAISLKRWNDFRNALLHLGEGRLDQQLKIRNVNDAFERMEVLFNMVIEELRRRLLHLSFTKPASFNVIPVTTYLSPTITSVFKMPATLFLRVTNSNQSC